MSKSFKFITGVVLAAGKGVRMNSQLPKVLHKLCGLPLIYYPLSLLSSLHLKNIIVVLGHKKEEVKEEIVKEFKGINFACQRVLNGSAKALESALKYVDTPYLLVMCADSSFLDKKVFQKAISFHISKRNACTVLSRESSSPSSLGRIIRDSRNEILEIREEVDLDRKNMPSLKEVNAGIYIFNREELSKQIKKVKPHPKKKEYFLTDIIEIFRRKNYKVRAFKVGEREIFYSVNSLKDLIEAEKVVRTYLIEGLIDKGVRILDPQTTFLGPKTFIGKNSVIYPFTFLENNVKIGNSCGVGPFVHLREGTVIGDNSYIGNFTELVRTKLSSRVKMKHFGYLGDTEVGSKVNIGAGVVTANFDGKKKSKTKISDSAFIGSDTIIVAPVKIGKSAFTGAGSVITKDVEDKTLVVGVPAKKVREIKNV
ncbi:MAG TPA: bifunctional N-acetylglucosamine-1-phosphate uridyltransferase/glucosamine-1-phosphate acetyltransferase [Candidatus Omnitrophica bacterium]|nr:bifunctional N-acetylglucosamine-1-phosphate uridyltransferase/glucosamine-1-phosphate acetyltransferase [Candidatus Omnitrophota bacterium]